MMTRKAALRDLRTGTIINVISTRQEKALGRAVKRVADALAEKFQGASFGHETQWMLNDVVNRLRIQFPDVDFLHYFNTSAMRPDGGILSLMALDGTAHPILIAEKKNQGTNNLRAAEGLAKQASITVAFLIGF